MLENGGTIWFTEQIQGIFVMNSSRLIVVDLLLLFAASTLLMVLLIFPVPVNVEFQTLTGTKTVTYLTSSSNVSGLIHQICRDDAKNTENIIVDTDGNEPIRKGSVVQVRKATVTTAKVGGTKEDICLYPGTIEENLAINGITYDDDDIVYPAVKSEATASTVVKVKEVHYETEELTKTVEAEDEVVFDTGVASGTIQTQEGSDGEGVYKQVTTYVNGKKKDVKTTFKKWIKEPKNNKLTFGTSATGETGAVSYSRIFTAETTAYYAGKNAHGAIGTSCHYGTCAVDPTVIPYGTRLYIEGYGVALANDCGGAVKGNIVDLYMNSTSQCIQWGRRYVTAYVLE